MITEEQKKEYISGYLLKILLEKEKKFPVLLESEDQDLEELFVFMMAKEYVKIDSSNFYIATEKGAEKFMNLLQRYHEYLSHFDIYSAVDLQEGEFAFEKFFDMEDTDFQKYLEQERFYDLRIAVAEFKKIPPENFVFLSFLQEGRFGNPESGWQFDLKSGLIWNEIEQIVESAIHIPDLSYTDEQGVAISGEEVIIDIIEEGSKINAELYEKERQLEDSFEDDEDLLDEYESYLDPSYRSSSWLIF